MAKHQLVERPYQPGSRDREVLPDPPEDTANTIWTRRDFFTAAGWGAVLVYLGTVLLAFTRFMFPRVLFEPNPVLAICTHLGCTPNWLKAENKFKCPCHGSGFKRDGTNFEGPAPRPLDRIKIARTPEGQLVVDKSAIYRMAPGVPPAAQYPQSIMKVWGEGRAMRGGLEAGRRVALVALLLAVTLAGWGQAAEPRAVPGHAAPDFTAPDVRGRPVRLADFRGKQAVLLNFWATWCVPCRLEMPTMEQVYGDYKGRGLEILAVSVDAGHLPAVAAAVTQFMQELKLTFPAVLDPEMEVARRYGVFGIPMTFLIDREGMIRAREPGFRDWTTPDSRTKLEELLGQRR